MSSPLELATRLAELIRAHGGRATPARIKVLGLLQARDQALSHGEVEEALSGEGIDRVTLYRVLDWLTESGLARRSTDAARLFRFSAAAPAEGDHGAHAHFHCEACHQDFCLEGMPLPAAALPSGFELKAAEFKLSGCCADCKEQE